MINEILINVRNRGVSDDDIVIEKCVFTKLLSWVYLVSTIPHHKVM